MGDLWTPPRGFFPAAQSWFHAANIARFETIEAGDSECDFINATTKVQNFVPGCNGGMTGRRIHFWKGDPPTDEFWATISGCAGADYNLSAGCGHDVYDGKMTISTNVAATLSDFFRMSQHATPYGTACAIRYGWLFSDETIEWWRRDGYSMHWLGPA